MNRFKSVGIFSAMSAVILTNCVNATDQNFVNKVNSCSDALIKILQNSKYKDKNTANCMISKINNFKNELSQKGNSVDAAKFFYEMQDENLNRPVNSEFQKHFNVLRRLSNLDEICCASDEQIVLEFCEELFQNEMREHWAHLNKSEDEEDFFEENELEKQVAIKLVNEIFNSTDHSKFNKIFDEIKKYCEEHIKNLNEKIAAKEQFIYAAEFSKQLKLSENKLRLIEKVRAEGIKQTLEQFGFDENFVTEALCQYIEQKIIDMTCFHIKYLISESLNLN